MPLFLCFDNLENIEMHLLKESKRRKKEMKREKREIKKKEINKRKVNEMTKNKLKIKHFIF